VVTEAEERRREDRRRAANTAEALAPRAFWHRHDDSTPVDQDRLPDGRTLCGIACMMAGAQCWGYNLRDVTCPYCREVIAEMRPG
jgi:hypothetical protein